MNHLRVVWISIAALVVVGCSVVAFMRFQGPATLSTAGDVTGDGEVVRAVPQAAEWLSQLSPEIQKLVESQQDAEYADILIANFYLGDRLTGSDEELRPFLNALQRFDPDAAISAEGFDRAQTAGLALAFLAQAWVQVGPFPALEAECIAEATRLARVRDEIVQLQAVTLLEVIRRHRADRALPAEAQAALEEGMANDWIRHQVERQLNEVLKPAADTVGRELPGG